MLCELFSVDGAQDGASKLLPVLAREPQRAGEEERQQ